MMANDSLVIPPERIEKSILVIRGHKVLLDRDLAAKLEKMECKLGEHDQHFQVVFEAIRQLMAPPAPTVKKRRIGFHGD